MTTYIILCSFLAISLVSADPANRAIQDVKNMSDREMMEYLMARVSRLESDRTMQDKRIAALETDRMVQDKRIAVLEDTVVKQNELIVTLQKVLAEKDLVVEAEARQDDVHDGKAEKQVSSDRKKPFRQHERIARRAGRQVSGRPVAFSSTLTSSIPHLGAHQNIVFNHTLVNIDNVYNPHHGVFTAPVKGIYVITGTILAYNNREVWCDIVVDGAAQARVYARGTDNRHDQGTQTILVHLNKGDDVAIQNIANDDAVYGEALSYTTFSGFLLYEEEGGDIIG